VTDAKSGEALPGVSILIKGTRVGTITDLDGKYLLSVPPDGILVFSFMGYTTKEAPVNNATVIDMAMEEDVIGLDEVVVVGYGVQKKSDLTGAVGSVSGDELRKTPLATIDHALQGQAAGVQITERSGRPGESADIQIRGISSINGTQPLIIIDGVPSDNLNNINPHDIASIEVLKDASTAAIYGSTGGNGVILITTKQGKPGKLTANLNIYRGVESPISKIELMDSWDYLGVLSDGSTPTIKDTIKLDLDNLETYDWQDIVFNSSTVENYDFSFSGGNEFSSFLASAGYNKQEGIVRNTDYQKFTFRINSEHKLLKRLTIDEKINYVNTVGKGFEEWKWHQYYWNPLFKALVMDPTVPDYTNGTWSRSPFLVENPVVNLDMMDRTEKNNYFNGNFGLKINIIKGLDVINRFAGELTFYDLKEYEGKFWASEVHERSEDRLIQNMSRTLTYNVQNIIQYNNSFGGVHNFLIMGGHEASELKTYDIGGTRLGMASDDPWMLYFIQSTNDSSTAQFITGGAEIENNEAYFARLNYDYKGKYLISINIRRDGSSKFGPNNKWGTFPSFSLGWKFSEENFLKNNEFINFGKIRFGYGQTGANARTGFPYLPKVEAIAQYRYSFNNEISTTGKGPTQIANPDLSWEKVNMTNLGVDLGFFENRLFITADFFDKVNDGMIIQQETPMHTGTYVGSNLSKNYPEVNIGSVRNRGYEVTISAKKKEGELTGYIDLNLTGIKNEVLELAEDSLLKGRVHLLQPTSLTYEGGPVAQFYGYQTEGLFTLDDPTIEKKGKTVIINQPYSINETTGDTTYMQEKAEPGDVRYADLDGDGKLTINDRTVLGSPIPKLIYGFTINLEYKGLDLSAFFNGTIGNKILNGTKQFLYYHQGQGNRAEEFTNRYVKEDIIRYTLTGEEVVILPQNHDTDLPSNKPENYNKLRPFYIEDGSYLRLRNLVLGYTIPEKITSKISIQQFRIYAGAKNLFTLTKYMGFSPDVAGKQPENPGEDVLEMGVDLGVYPVTRMYYFGANITF
ncbi:MAG: TonB-dependent receptor, partial [Bacteroidales bacterium]|nr:TonB-dependent receptor [Bacteroidales bacterium]